MVAIGAMGTLMVMGGDNGGYMVKNDPEEFTDRVLELFNDKELHKNKSAEAVRHADSWSILEMTRKLEEFYLNCTKNFQAEFGEPRALIWKLLTNSRSWKTFTNVIRRRAGRRLQEMISKLGF